MFDNLHENIINFSLLHKLEPEPNIIVLFGPTLYKVFYSLTILQSLIFIGLRTQNKFFKILFLPVYY